MRGLPASKLEERLTDLEEQNIFSPQMIFIDGFQIDDTARTSLSDLKSLAEKHSLYVWLTIKTHRHEKPDPDGMPAPLLDVVDLFDLVIQLQPEGKEIHVKTLKGTGAIPTNRHCFWTPQPCCSKKQRPNPAWVIRVEHGRQNHIFDKFFEGPGIL